MVGRAAGDGARVGRIRSLHNIPDFSERLFSFGPWDGCAAGSLIRALADVLAPFGVARLGAEVGFARDAYSLDAGRVSADLLLLSQGILPGILFGSSGVCRWRAAGSVQGRDAPPPIPEYPPVLLICRPH